MQSNLEILLNLKYHSPHTPAVISNDKIITYEELDIQSSFLALKLSEKISGKEYVGIYLDNSPEYITAILALWKLGAVPVPLNLLAVDDELFNQVNTVGISTIISDDPYSQKLESIHKVSSKKINVIQPEINIVERKKSTGKDISQQQTYSDAKLHNDAVVIFTSGASGKPKGVAHTFNSLLSSIYNGNEILNHRSGDRWLASLPFYHIGGFQIICRAFYYKAALVILHSLQTEEISEAINKFYPTHASFVSAQLKRLLDHQIKPNNELRCSLIGGGFIDKKLLLDAKISGWHPVKVYGSSETASFVCALNENDIELKGDSTGKPLGNNQIIIVDENGIECPFQTEGEIVIKSDSLFKNYLNSESETKNKLKQDSYFTGDLGYIDDDGFLFVTGRKNEMIVTGAKNVNPLEVETAILKYPGIVEASVFPIDDVEWGEIVCAAIVTNSIIELDDLKFFLRKELSSYKIPKRIFIEDSLPKTAMGKTKRSKLKNKYSGKV